MKSTFSKLVICASALSLGLTSIAASAGTRAGDNNAVYSSAVSNPGQNREVQGESVGGGLSFASLFIGLYVGVWTTLFVSEITEDDEFQSSGI